MEFPDSIGPFTMLAANLANAFNAFYRQNPAFPKPDPTSSESMMVGMEPSQAGMGGGDILFGQLSPLHEITLDEETKAAANIPAAATTFAWAYPMLLLPGQRLPARPAERAFVEYGGYVYFDDFRNAVGTNAIQPARFGTLGLMFGRPQLLAQGVADQLTRQGRFQEITLQALADKGATHFAWIRPGEFRDDVASFDGCFAYKFADETLKYFPIVSKPVFTKELLEETLDESEAWVVVRMPFPSIERINIYDKMKTLEDNLYNNNSHGLEFNGNISGVTVRRDGAHSRRISYDMWCNNDDPGAMTHPWIFDLELTSNVPDNSMPVVSDQPCSELEGSASAAPLGNDLKFRPDALQGDDARVGPPAVGAALHSPDMGVSPASLHPCNSNTGGGVAGDGDADMRPDPVAQPDEVEVDLADQAGASPAAQMGNDVEVAHPSAAPEVLKGPGPVVQPDEVEVDYADNAGASPIVQLGNDVEVARPSPATEVLKCGSAAPSPPPYALE